MVSAPSQRVVLLAAALMVVGRDGVLASNVLDTSGSPGGGESTYLRCGGRLVSGLYSRPSLPLGYSLITTVPVGACRLNISELMYSDNYLAVKLTNGSFIINGDFAVSSPGQYDAAGTRFVYRRGGALPEAIWASGPIDHPVDILILYQHPNPSIAYEYQIAIPPDEAYPKMSEGAEIAPPLVLSQNSSLLSQRHKHRFHQRPHSRPYGESPALGNNIPNHEVNRTSPSGRTAGSNDTLHGPPFTTRMLNTESARPHYSNTTYPRTSRKRKFIWKANGFSPCTRTCAGGAQMAIMQCVREYNHALVPERRCPQPKPKPLTRTCGSGPCTPRWQAGSWSSCPQCGPASKHRILACVQENASGMSKVSKAACVSDPPPEVEKCNIPDCTSRISADTQKTGSVNILLKSSPENDLPWPAAHHPNEETDNFKDSTTNIIITRYKNDSLYSDRRQIEDVSNDINNINVNRNGPNYKTVNNVDSLSKANDNSIYNAGNSWKSTGGVWMYSEWSEQCTESCGRGVQTRALLCTDPSGCDNARKPTTARFCASERGCSLQPATWFTGPWSPCSRGCGGAAAMMTREVACLSSTHGQLRVDTTGAACSRLAKPDNARPCSPANPSCPPEWYLSDWSQCTGPCGSSFQSRNVWCAMEDGPQGALPDNLCKDPKPHYKRSCVPSQCAGSYQGSNSIADNDGSEGGSNRECSDNFSSCGLAVQARLCQYRYYATSCCLSCQKAGALPSVIT